MSGVGPREADDAGDGAAARVAAAPPAAPACRPLRRQRRHAHVGWRRHRRVAGVVAHLERRQGQAARAAVRGRADAAHDQTAPDRRRLVAGAEHKIGLGGEAAAEGAGVRRVRRRRRLQTLLPPREEVTHGRPELAACPTFGRTAPTPTHTPLRIGPLWSRTAFLVFLSAPFLCKMAICPRIFFCVESLKLSSP